MHGHHCSAYIDPIVAHIIVISCAHAEHNLCCDAHLLGYHQADSTSKWASRELGTKLVCIYTWILLIVEISTKPKSINFAKIKRKRTPERLFPLQNAFFNSRTLPNGFKCFFNACLTLFERLFPLQNVQSVPNGKNHSSVLFSTQSPKNVFLGLELKNPVLGSFILIICINTLTSPNI